MTRPIRNLARALYRLALAAVHPLAYRDGYVDGHARGVVAGTQATAEAYELELDAVRRAGWFDGFRGFFVRTADEDEDLDGGGLEQ